MKSHLHTLITNGAELAASLDMSDTFKLCLLSLRVITDEHLEKLNEVRERPREQISRFLDILKRRADKHFEGFIKALHKTDQGHVAEILQPNAENSSNPSHQSDVPEVHCGSAYTGPSTGRLSILSCSSQKLYSTDPKLLIAVASKLGQDRRWQKILKIPDLQFSLLITEDEKCVIECEGDYSCSLKERMLEVFRQGKKSETDYIWNMRQNFGRLTMTIETQTGSFTQESDSDSDVYLPQHKAVPGQRDKITHKEKSSTLTGQACADTSEAHNYTQTGCKLDTHAYEDRDSSPRKRVNENKNHSTRPPQRENPGEEKTASNDNDKKTGSTRPTSKPSWWQVLSKFARRIFRCLFCSCFCTPLDWIRL